MTCKKCGKPCKGDLCDKCREEGLLYGEKWLIEPFTDEEDNGIAYGIGPAIASTVIGGVCTVFSLLALIFSSVFYRSVRIGETSFRSAIAVGIVFAFLGICGCAPTISLAATSVKYYIKHRNAGRKKPYATLALSIVGLSLSLLSFLLALGALLFLALSVTV